MTEPRQPNTEPRQAEADAVASRKRELRAALRERRRSIKAHDRERVDAAINRAVVDFAGEVETGIVAAFRAFDGEPDLTSALAELSRTGWHVVLPVLSQEPVGVQLEFRTWDPAARMNRNRFGIDEPRAGNRVAMNDIGLVLVPLVGWDEHGGRLGMGAGYYDRALAGVAAAASPVRAGIAYSVQRVDRVPTDEHDVPLHLVITEEGRFTCLS